MKRTKFALPLNLQLFADEAGAGGDQSGVESASAAGEQTQDGAGTEASDNAGQAEQEKQNNFEKAFAKRLQAERAKWESETAEKYKDHDTYRKATEYLQKTSGITDVLTLREQIELTELQERAEEANVPPEVLKRLDQLEQKAAKADEMEAAAKQQEEWQSFETTLKTFAEGKQLGDKPLDHAELWKYMHENGVSKPEVAYKAMKSDLLEAQLETARKDAVEDYLKTKQAPKTNGATGAVAATTPEPAKGWKGVEQRAAERMRAARTPQ